MYSLQSFVSFSFILFYKYAHVLDINGYSKKKLEIENVTIEEILKALSDNKALSFI